MGRIVHFEIPSENPETSMAFYAKVFGWKFERFGEQQYWLAITGNDKEPGINGAIMKRMDPRQPVANHIAVEDIDASMKQVETSGGTIVVPKTAVPSVGYYCFFKDLDGNIFGMWREDSSAK